MIWWTPIVVVGVMLLKRDSLCRGVRFEFKETNLIAKEGDCVQISCTGYNIISDEYTWFWYKNAKFYVTSKKYNGTVLYTNHRERKAHRDFEGRVTVGYPKEPTSTYEWEVQICCLRMNDSGGYSFRYEGSDKYFLEAKLQVHENPCKVSFQYNTIHLNESDEAVFTCSTSSSCGRRPLIGGLPMHAQLDERNNTSIVARLRLNWTDHQIQLSCDVPGAISECLRQNITLTVQYTLKKPVLNGTRKKVPLGESLTLTCSAEANPAPTYTWFLPWKNETTHSAPWLNQNPNNRLEIQRVARAHNGCYHCSASNPLGRGENSSSYCVEVLYPPDNVSVEWPSSPVLEGSYVRLSCNGSANPPADLYTWYRSRLNPGTDQGPDEGPLDYDQSINVSVSADAQYFCEVRNPHGAKNSSLTQMVVHYPPREVELRVEPPGGVQEGRGFTLSCSCRAWPSSNYTLYLVSGGAPGVRVPLQDHGANLTVERAERRHGGRYYCLAGNYLGAKESDPVQLDVHFAAEILNSSHCVRLPSGVHCSCESQGNPVPTLTWTLDGEAVYHSAHCPIREFPTGNLGIISFISLPQSDKDPPTVMCLSNNSMGDNRLELNSEFSKSEPDLVLCIVISAVMIVGLVCVGVCIMRTRKVGEETRSFSAATVKRAPPDKEESQVVLRSEEDIYVNSGIQMNPVGPREEPVGPREEAVLRAGSPVSTHRDAASSRLIGPAGSHQGRPVSRELTEDTQ